MSAEAAPVTYAVAPQQGATYTTLPAQYAMPPQTSSYVPPQEQALPQVYMDPENIKHQKTQSLTMLDSQLGMAKDSAKNEYEQAKQSINMKASYDLQTTTSAIEQSRAQALFALDQQHQQRRMEIEQRAQEQRMQIEATASQLCMQAQQQKMQKEMAERMAKLQQAQAAQQPQYTNQATAQYLPQQTGSYVPPQGAQYIQYAPAPATYATLSQPGVAQPAAYTTSAAAPGVTYSYPAGYPGNTGAPAFGTYNVQLPQYGQPQPQVISSTVQAAPAQA